METEFARSLIECSRAFRYPYELKHHLRSSLIQHPFCAICGQHFPGQVSYESHKAAKHPQPTPVVYSCPSCPRKVFTTQGALNDHYRDSPRHPKCQNCMLGFKDQLAYADHVRIAHPVRRCPICSVTLFDDESLEDHLYVSANHPSCTSCRIGFKDEHEADNHKIAFHPEIRCKLCECRFETSHSLHKHYRSSSKHGRCLDCGCGRRSSNEFHNADLSSSPKHALSSKTTSAAGSSPKRVSEPTASTPTCAPALSVPPRVSPPIGRLYSSESVPAFLNASSRSSSDAPLIEEDTVRDEEELVITPSTRLSPTRPQPKNGHLDVNVLATPGPSTAASDCATFSHSTSDNALSNCASPRLAMEPEAVDDRSGELDGDAELEEAKRMLELEQVGNRMFPLRLRPSQAGDEFVHHISASASPLSPIPSRPWTDARQLLEMAASQTSFLPVTSLERSMIGTTHSDYSSFSTSPKPGAFQSLQMLVHLEVGGSQQEQVSRHQSLGLVHEDRGWDDERPDQRLLVPPEEEVVDEREIPQVSVNLASTRMDDFEVDIGEAVPAKVEEITSGAVAAEAVGSGLALNMSEVVARSDTLRRSRSRQSNLTRSTPSPFDPNNFSKGWKSWHDEFSHGSRVGLYSSYSDQGPQTFGFQGAGYFSTRSGSTSPRSPRFFSSQSSPFLASSPAASARNINSLNDANFKTEICPRLQVVEPEFPLCPETPLRQSESNKAAQDRLTSLLQLSEDFNDCVSPFVADFSTQQLYTTALSTPSGFKLDAGKGIGDVIDVFAEESAKDVDDDAFSTEEPAGTRSARSTVAQRGGTTDREDPTSSSQSSRFPSTSGSWSDMGDYIVRSQVSQGLDIVLHQATPSQRELVLSPEPELNHASKEEANLSSSGTSEEDLTKIKPKTTEDPPAVKSSASPLHCRICLRDHCENVTATMCGHIFCNKCITDAIIAAPRCPVCSTPTLLYCLFRLDLSV